ncbi:hypothetical protein [Jatrophihabitans sp.]|jgi:hypothetical protein|uniref:hypothetical protein n=1 Tax=Jatrophihabitans sp. TaxID=1932789 RepID=UPI002EDD8E14
MAESQQPPNPLQLGQTLYEVLDASLVATPRGAATASYNRVIYNAGGGTPVEPLDVGSQSQILDVKAATIMHTAVQSIFVLTAQQVQVIGSAGGAATSTSWPVSGLSRIVDVDPQQLDHPALLLLGQDGKGSFLQSLDCSTGTLATQLRLPATVTGTAVGALLVRNQLDAHVLVCTQHDDGQLVVYDLGSGALGTTPAVGTVGSVSLGVAQASAVPGITAASLIAGTADQQAVLTYPDSTGALQIAVLGWTKGALATLATLAPSLSFATPDRTVFRVAAGSLLGDGIDQVVVGYAATYGSVQGCAALLLLELQAASDASLSLKLLSTYAVANAGQPFASVDLHLAMGLFGEELPSDQPAPVADSTAGVLGVLLVGGGASFSQVLKGEASILAGLVPVNPVEKAFPRLGSAPAVAQGVSTLMTIDYRSPGFFALPSDVTGQSVILGPPTLSQALGKGQLLAIVQAPPFELGVSANKPTLAFGQSVSQIKGYNVSSNKTWMFSQDTGLTIGISGQTLGRNVSNSYGHGFDQIDDNSTSTLVQSTASITSDDLMVLYSMSYYVWTYPVYRKAKQSAPDGTMAVIFPMTPEPEQSLLPANDPSLGYKPRSQSGVLLSYANLQPDGYDPSTLLFNLINASVTDDQSGISVFYDQTEMVTENVSKTFMVHNSTTDSGHFSISTTLLDYVPINFGLNMSQGQSYSESDVQTTMLSHTTTMSMTVTTGSVTDIGYEYQMTPYIYQHETMGCLMVTFGITMSGKSWNSYYKIPQVLLQPLYPNSKNVVLAGFSRSISFQHNDDGTVGVSVELFNNGLEEIQNVVCDFYKGPPTSAGDKLTPSGSVVGSQSLPTLLGSGRAIVQLDMDLADEDQVVVNVYVQGLQQIMNKVYWGVYPPPAFMDWQGRMASLAAEREGADAP